MNKLTRSDLYSLEQYADTRAEFRTRVIAHKQNRRVRLGEIATLYFEDRLTMHYQIQEMLRVERIFEADGIQEELDAYNPLIPDGKNLKATFMIEVADEEARRKALMQLKGIENEVWLRVHGFDPVFAIADEDMERANEDKTSAVHFMRFEFSDDMVTAAKAGAALGAGISHSEYTQQLVPLPDEIHTALLQDFV